MKLTLKKFNEILEIKSQAYRKMYELRDTIRDMVSVPLEITEK